MYSSPVLHNFFFFLAASIAFHNTVIYVRMIQHPNEILLHNYNIAISAKEFATFSEQLCLN